MLAWSRAELSFVIAFASLSYVTSIMGAESDPFILANLTMLVYLIGFLTAVSNASASLLQREANKREAADSQFSMRMVLDLLKQRVWLGGIGFMTLSFLLQTYGLSISTLATIQCLMMLELPLTLIGASLFLGSELDAKEWLSIAVMTTGIIGLIAALDPQKSHGLSIPPGVWILAGGATAGVILALVLLGTKISQPNRQSALLGTATGVTFGLTAAFLKGMTIEFSRHGLIGALASWHLYLAIATGATATWLFQNAVHRGQLVAAQPGVTMADPCTSIIWGALVFNEQVRGGYFIVFQVIAAVAMGSGAVLLAKSPALEQK